MLLFGVLSFILTQCTIQKRVHQKGWDIQWRSNRGTVQNGQLENHSDDFVTSSAYEEGERSAKGVEILPDEDNIRPNDQGPYQHDGFKDVIADIKGEIQQARALANEGHTIKQAVKIRKVRKDEDGGTSIIATIALFILFIGVLVLVVGVLLKDSASGNSPGDFIFGSVWAFFGLLIGAVLLILGVGFAIAGATVSENPSANKTKKPAPKEKKEEPVREPMDPVKEKRSGLIAALVVVGVGLAIVLTYVILASPK